MAVPNFAQGFALGAKCEQLKCAVMEWSPADCAEVRMAKEAWLSRQADDSFQRRGVDLSLGSKDHERKSKSLNDLSGSGLAKLRGN